MIGRIIGYLAVSKHKLNLNYDGNKILKSVKEMRFLADKSKKLSFFTLPWNFWINSIFILLASMFLTYYLYFILHREEFIYILLVGVITCVSS